VSREPCQSYLRHFSVVNDEMCRIESTRLVHGHHPACIEDPDRRWLPTLDKSLSRAALLSNHFDASGNARMVDVSEKPVSVRTATAMGLVIMQPSTSEMIQNHQAAKGDVLGIARIAAINAVKLTPSLIPLCHAILIDGVEVRFAFLDETTLSCEVDVRSTGRTGVEMEAMSGVAAACLTVYDMCKSVDRGIRLDSIRLLAKEGGKSGQFRSP
jgi:cyclic pyranopterin monophosphate synthase